MTQNKALSAAQLLGLLEEAIAKGLDPETAVVVAWEGDWREIARVVTPVDQAGLEDGFAWFTMYPGEFAGPPWITRGHGH